MQERIFVALDLETTGLDAKKDKIIEIGAVKFQGDRVLDTFTTFVKPNRPIPLRIRQITGISDEDVAHAPEIEQVIPEVLAFVDSEVAALVAHNAPFDIGFMQAAGVNFHRPAQDTFELATILLPGRNSYNLGQLCKEEGITLESAHRALDDAAATAQLFMRLQEKLRALPTHVVSSVIDSAQSLTNQQTWAPLALFVDALKSSSSRSARLEDLPTAENREDISVPTARPLNDDSIEPINEPTYQLIDPDAVAASFAPTGSLAEQMGSTYEARAGQQQMARQIAEVLNAGESLIIEAGTGTGKSLAYLLPAALWSLKNQRRILIATNTIPLQEQLLNKDIPQLQKLLETFPEDSSHFRAALLKGRRNYLCMRRLNLWRKNRQISSTEMMVLARVLVWQHDTKMGDVSELFLPTAEEREIWSNFSSDGSTCNESRCEVALASDSATSDSVDLAQNCHDYYLAARQSAKSANLLIINHALLLADVATENNLIPAYDHLIVDETHHLEDAATDQLTYSIYWQTLRRYLAQFQSTGQLIVDLKQMLNAENAIDEGQRNAFYDQFNQLQQKTKQVDKKIGEFEGQLVAYAITQKGVKKAAAFPQRLYLSNALRDKPAWSQLETEWDLTSYDLNELLKKLNQLMDTLEALEWPQNKERPKVLYELNDVITKVGEMHQALDQTLLINQRLSGNNKNKVYWLQLDRYTTTATVNVTPLSVSDTLEKALVREKRSAIFTGATLRAGPTFDFMGERLGLWDVKAATVESPFDYKKNTLLYMPESMPTPDQPAYQQAVEQAIIAAATATNGRTMALFTSHAHLRVTADAIRSSLDQLGITVLQHGSGGRARLLREFKAADKAILLGTRTFWEGVDLPGDDLQSLLIVKLPFAVPNDPMVAARSAEFDDPFSSYMLPEAIIRFRQGFGRLIRRIDDRGAVVLLDSRLWHKSYGQAFLDALPPCTVRRAPLENIQSEIEEWMSKSE